MTLLNQLKTQQLIGRNPACSLVKINSCSSLLLRARGKKGTQAMYLWSEPTVAAQQKSYKTHGPEELCRGALFSVRDEVSKNKSWRIDPWLVMTKPRQLFPKTSPGAWIPGQVLAVHWSV